MNKVVYLISAALTLLDLPATFDLDFQYSKVLWTNCTRRLPSARIAADGWFAGCVTLQVDMDDHFLANVNSCSCSLYVVVRPSVCHLSSVCL